MLEDSGQIVVEKLATLYAQRLMTSILPESWKDANIIRMEGAVKDSRNWPINLLSVAYEIYTKAIANRSRKTFGQSTK